MKKLILLLALTSTAMFAQLSDRKYSAVLTSTCSNATSSCDVSGTTAFGQNGEVLGPQTLEANITGYGVATITARGTFTGSTISFEFSDDGGTSWYATVCARSDSAVLEGSSTLADNTQRAWDCGISAATRFRVRQTAITTGGPMIGMTLSSAQYEPAQTVSAVGSVNTGTASATTQGGYPMMCDTAASGTVTVGQAQMVRCTTSGIVATAIAAAVGDGATNANAYVNGDLLGTGANNSGLRIAPNIFNGTAWDHYRSAALANFPASSTLTARNSIGAAISERGSRWSVNSTPAVSTQASASIAAEASVRHVADSVCFSAGATTAPALTNLQINIRDGATGAGTILASFQVVIPATAVQHITPYCISGLNLVGTTNTAMTAEWSALLTNEFEQVTITGFNVN